MIHTRSKERVQELGEVFTPPHIADEMLDLLEKGREDENIFADPSIIFFEPTCGNGNIVVQIVKRRLSAFKKAFEKEGYNHPEKWAIAATIQNLYACDVDDLEIAYVAGFNAAQDQVIDRVCEFLENEFTDYETAELIQANKDRILK